jgi:hypothetical protein
MPTRATYSRRPALFIALATLFFAAVIALAIAAGSDAKKGKGAKILGSTQKTPKPLCPKECAGTGSVTGFQVSANGKKGLFRIPDDGHIVAWAIDASKPTPEDIAGFGELFEDKKFGTEPVAKLAVLQKKGKKKPRYKLAKQSPTVDLLPELGRKPIFTLNKPLKVKRGQVAALTMPTWATNWTDRVESGSNSWKASRPAGDCSAETVPDAKPHLRKGTTRTYGCDLRGERILYWAYFVPDKGKGGGKGDGGKGDGA